MKFSSVSFHKNIRVPNLGSVSGVTAAAKVQDRDGFDIDYDEEYGFITVTAKKPRSEKDKVPGRCFRENVSEFALLVEEKKEASK